MPQSYDPKHLAQEEEELPVYDSHSFLATTSKESNSCGESGVEIVTNKTKSILKQKLLRLRSFLDIGRVDYLLTVVMLLFAGGMAALVYHIVTMEGPPATGSENNPMFVHLVTRTVTASASAAPEVGEPREQNLTLAVLKLVNGTLSSHQAAH